MHVHPSKARQGGDDQNSKYTSVSDMKKLEPCFIVTHEKLSKTKVNISIKEHNPIHQSFAHAR